MINCRDDWTVFDAPAQTIVNTVNCVGVMGKGLALEVKRRFPVVYEKYRHACKRGELKVGNLQLVKTKEQWVLNFPTKNHWRGRSKTSFIEKGLKKFVSTYKRRGITSIAFPPLGCGSGGLKWEEVRPIMERYLEPLPDLEIFICLAGLDQRPQKASGLRAREIGGRKTDQIGLPF